MKITKQIKRGLGAPTRLGTIGSSYELTVDGDERRYTVHHGLSKQPGEFAGLYSGGQAISPEVLLELLEQYWNENPELGPEDLYDL